jgi:ABC-type glycerol-3-phosphate transport system substrate-binding protein
MEIEFWHAMGGPLGDVLEEMISEFNDSQDEIKVISVSMGSYQALSQKIMASVAADNPPDLAQAYEAWTAELIENGSVVPLDDIIAGPEGLSQESFDDILPVFIGNNTWYGKIYSFPFNKSVRAIYYNKGLFELVGLPDRGPETWEEYYEFAKALTIDTNADGNPEQWGTAGQLSVWMFENLLLQNGGKLMEEDGTTPAFNSPEGVEALSFLKRLLASDVGYITAGYEYQNDFLAGKVAMMEGSTVSIAFIQDQLSFDMGIAPLPKKKRPAVIVAGTNVVIFESSKPEKKLAAWEFIKWFTDTENTARWSAETGYVPVRRSALESEVMLRRFEEMPGLREVYEQLNYAEYEPRTSIWFAGRKWLEEIGVEGCLRGKFTAKEALDKIAEMIREEVERTG